jgi:glycosyltransferase involved in cell wall biosynthesis
MKTAIIIPAYNEEKTISNVIKNAKPYGTVIVVDDCSRDGTSQIARKSGAIVLRHEKNRGLGGALRTGFDAALKRGFDIIITIDADGQHRSEEIPKFVEKINEGYDFVLGRRDLHRYPFIKKFGNFFLNMATNFISGTVLFDTESGFRAFTSSALKKLYLRAERYEIAVEIIFEVGRNRLNYANVDIESPLYRKGVSFWDGINNFRYLVQRRKRSFFAYMEDFMYVMKNTARVILKS